MFRSKKSKSHSSSQSNSQQNSNEHSQTNVIQQTHSNNGAPNRSQPLFSSTSQPELTTFQPSASQPMNFQMNHIFHQTISQLPNFQQLSSQPSTLQCLQSLQNSLFQPTSHIHPILSQPSPSSPNLSGSSGNCNINQSQSNHTSQEYSYEDEDDQEEEDEERQRSQEEEDDEKGEGKEVEIVDEQDKFKRKQIMKAKDVFKIVNGERMLVRFNELNQPIEYAAGVLTRWLTLLAKQSTLCPPDAVNFRQVKKFNTVELLRVVRSKVCIPDTEAVDKFILKCFGRKFRDVRHRYKIEYETAKHKMDEHNDKLIREGGDGQPMTIQDIINTPPKGLTSLEWARLIEYFDSDKGKHYAKIAKEARDSQLHTHTTGAVSYARARNNLEKKLKRKAGPIEFFDHVHRTKKGGYIQEDSQKFMEKVKEKMSSSVGDIDKEKQVWEELMGEDMPGRARGYGLGVTKTQVTGYLADLRDMRKTTSSSTSNSSTSSESFTMLQNQCTQMHQEIISLRSIVQQFLPVMQQFLPIMVQMCGTMPTNNLVNPSSSSIDPIQLFRLFQMTEGVPMNPLMGHGVGTMPIGGTHAGNMLDNAFGRQVPDASSGNDSERPSPGDNANT